jgi:hypothetical protein
MVEVIGRLALEDDFFDGTCRWLEVAAGGGVP